MTRSRALTRPTRDPGARSDHGVPGRRRPPRHRSRRPPRRGLRPARTQRRREDHHRRDPEGFRQRSAGEVRVLGADPERGDDTWRGRIGLVLQSWRDHPCWRVAELLTHFATYYPDPRDPAELLALVGLTDQADRQVNRLSGGQRRRLDVALGIVGRPELSSWTSRPPASTPRHGASSTSWSNGWPATKASPSCSPPTTWWRPQRLADRIAMLVGGRSGPAAPRRELAPSGCRPGRGPLDGRRRDAPPRTHRRPSQLVWELHRNADGPIADLEVRRPTLEDTYSAHGAPGGRRHGRGRDREARAA